jgi:hypothetical protein
VLLGLLTWIASGPAAAVEVCTMKPCNASGTCAYSHEAATCRCPAGTRKVRPPNPDRYPNGADLCQFGQEPSAATCTWNYECVRTTQSDDKCLVARRKTPGVPCDRSPDLTIEVTNNCDGPRKIQICIETTGSPKMDCAASPDRRPIGGTFSHRACRVTGRFNFRSVR